MIHVGNRKRAIRTHHHVRRVKRASEAPPTAPRNGASGNVGGIKCVMTMVTRVDDCTSARQRFFSNGPNGCYVYSSLLRP